MEVEEKDEVVEQNITSSSKLDNLTSTEDLEDSIVLRQEDATVDALLEQLSDQEDDEMMDAEVLQMNDNLENWKIDETHVEENVKKSKDSESFIEDDDDDDEDDDDDDDDDEDDDDEVRDESQELDGNMKRSNDEVTNKENGKKSNKPNLQISSPESQINQNYRITTDSIFELYDKQRMQWHKLRKDWMEQREAVLLHGNNGRNKNNNNLIFNRFEEIKAMSSKIIRATQFISSLPLHQQDLINKLHKQSEEEFKQQLRSQWNSLDLIKYAFRMVLLFKRASRPRRKYIEEIAAANAAAEKSNKTSPSDKIAYSKDDRSKERCTISSELRLCLLTRPQFRTKSDLQRIIFYLRSTKPFTHLFPLQMELECARYVEYESYADKRILACQNRTPERFYFVINGKMACIKQYDLSDGVINQNLKLINKGMTTNPKSMEEQKKNEFFLVTDQTVEVLSIHKSTYFHLLKSYSGLPLEFLRSIKLFKKFPCELFYSNLESINMRYYSQNTIVVADSNRTPWLYVIKSGFVKVVRKQNIYACIEKSSPLNRNVKKSSHAKEMLGLTYRQRLLISDLNNELHLPIIESSSVGNPLNKTLNIPDSTSMLKNKFQRSRTVLPLGIAAEYKTQMKTANFVRSQTIVSRSTHTEENEDLSNVIATKLQENNDDSARERKTSRTEQVASTNSNGNKQQSKMNMFSKSPALDGDAKIINLSRINFQEDVREQQRKYMTEEKRKMATVLTGKQMANISERSTLIQLDVLQSGNIFGLHHLEAPVASEPEGLLLISDGAEIIRISKRFFVQQARNNTLLKIQKQCKIYMSEKEAKNDLLENEIWNQFKSNEVNNFVQRLKNSNK